MQPMKGALHTVLGLVLLATAVEVQGQFYYSHNPDYGSNNPTITITGYYGPDGNVNIPATIDGYTVTIIGEDAFLEDIGVTDITIPASVTSIGESAFSDSGLTAVTIPASVANIGPEAFANCASLANASLANGVISIGASAFGNCPVLTSVTIPGSVISIGPYAFNYCSSLTNATISNGLVSIGDAAFEECTSLTNFTIPDSVSSIGEDAFYECRSLTSITIPGSVTSIGLDAFNYCYRLTAITVDAQNPAYSSVDGVLFDKSVTTLIQAPGGLGGNYTIPTSVTRIGEDAFNFCLGLTNIAIPVGVTSIGEQAFSACFGLTNITILNGLTSIGDAAFYNCAGLTSITIPSSVTNIGENSFNQCGSLNNVTIPGSVTSIGAYAFSYCNFLSKVYFGGDAPTADSTVFIGDNPGLVGGTTVYYLPGTTGWSSAFAGRPTGLWELPYPVILNNGPKFGVQSNSFGFTISWATNGSFVVEASSNLAGAIWTPLQTNTLTNGSFYFSEPFQTNSFGRFYRVKST
jgi:hypothetical protein